MQFKKLSLFIFLTVLFMFSSCSIDPAETLPGTWSTSDGGTITFNGDGSGITTGSDYFEFDCGSLNGVQIGPINTFTWEITSSGNTGNSNVRLEYSDPVGFPNCAGSGEYPIDFSGKNKVTVGVVVFGIGNQIELTR